ncbi:response regulator transcription factor [Micromonospora sp. WMMD1102]|uniref:response regulator transcription factor n=1 Tax=Micromonospora sp. WMMD1102 TaxID=3016105 RepID=UPI002414D363|nr:response regulator transcription factor [Micromonospora sp. WMMD1102]MDG4789356.1 response regulator transcription factor [Micromonospora sp. WMMD1102]
MTSGATPGPQPAATGAGPAIRVLLVDDDALVRTGLRLMLGGAPDIEVVGETADGADVADAVTRLRPDVVLMDVRMPLLDGIAATRAITARSGQRPEVIVLTTFDADATILDALRNGAAGFLVKHTPPEQIVDAVRRAAAGEPVLSPTVARTLIDHVAGVAPHRRPDQRHPDQRRHRARERFGLLSERERAVAVAVAEGLSNGEIADRLFLSVGTVKAYVSSALAKLDLDNRIQLALLAHDARDE